MERPAFDVTGKIVVNVLPVNEDPDLKLTNQLHPGYNVSTKELPPHDTQSPYFAAFPKYIKQGEISTPIITTPKMREQLKKGTLYIVVHARVTYEDVFGVEHWLQHCSHGLGSESWPGVRLSSVGPTGICGQYNDTDKNF
jgi:hypothetical protein